MCRRCVQIDHPEQYLHAARCDLLRYRHGSSALTLSILLFSQEKLTFFNSAADSAFISHRKNSACFTGFVCGNAGIAITSSYVFSHIFIFIVISLQMRSLPHHLSPHTFYQLNYRSSRHNLQEQRAFLQRKNAADRMPAANLPSCYSEIFLTLSVFCSSNGISSCAAGVFKSIIRSSISTLRDAISSDTDTVLRRLRSPFCFSRRKS